MIKSFKEYLSEVNRQRSPERLAKVLDRAIEMKSKQSPKPTSLKEPMNAYNDHFKIPDSINQAEKSKYHEMVNDAQNHMDKHDPDAMQNDEFHFPNIEKLPMKSLFATQHKVGVNKLQEPDEGIPLVVRHKKINYIWDGHHRIGHKFLRGDTHINARVLDLDKEMSR